MEGIYFDEKDGAVKRFLEAIESIAKDLKAIREKIAPEPRPYEEQKDVEPE